MDCHELRWQQMDSRREFSPSRRMRSLERGRSRTRSPRRPAYRADGGSPIRGRRGGSQGDPHAKAEPRPRPSGSDPWNLAGGQQGAGEGRHDDADMTDSPESARKADDEGDCEGVTTARGGGEQRLGREEADLQNRGAEERNSDAETDPPLEGMCEEGRVRCRGNTAADCSPDDRRKGSARRRESADAAGATDETDGSGERLHGSGDAAGATDENEMGGNGARRRGEERADAKEDDLQSDGRDGREERGCVMEEDRSANEMRGGGARRHEDMAADRAREEMREGSARRRGSMNADRSAGDMRGGARRRGGADAAGSTDGMRGNDTRRCGSADADSSAGEMPENGARRRGSADADRSPGRLRGSNARRGEGKETERAPGASREEERRRDVQAGVYSSPEPRRGHERRRRMALGGWRSPEQGGHKRRDGRRKQVSKVGAWVCVQVTPETEEKDKKVGAWADEPVAVGAERKDEKVGAWAAAEGEEKDEKEGAGACELVAAGAEEKDEQVGAWECAPAAAEAEEKDEQVGAWVCAPAAAEAEEKDEQVGAGACVTAAAEAEEKDEKVGAGVCVTAAAKAEEKEEQVGAGACVPAVAEAERKDEKVGARPCVLKAEKQVQGSMRAEQHVRKLREERPELLGEKMVKEAVRGAETGVRSIKVGMACDWGTGDLRVGGWEGPVWDKAQEQEEAERESKEVGAWECLPVGEERQHTMENATSQEAEEAVKTVRWIKGGTWADEPMRLASQVLSESRGMEEAEKWAAWEGGKAVGHLKEVILALVEDLHVVQMGDACSYEQRQQLGGRGTEEAPLLLRVLLLLLLLLPLPLYDLSDSTNATTLPPCIPLHVPTNRLHLSPLSVSPTLLNEISMPRAHLSIPPLLLRTPPLLSRSPPFCNQPFLSSLTPFPIPSFHPRALTFSLLPYPLASIPPTFSFPFRIAFNCFPASSSLSSCLPASLPFIISFLCFPVLPFAIQFPIPSPIPHFPSLPLLVHLCCSLPFHLFLVSLTVRSIPNPIQRRLSLHVSITIPQPLQTISAAIPCFITLI
ncbi:unnamed protein product [Closterium sp. NIES-64]|nr:unnamed protein product [Closterium sp. NIES-64]